MSRIETIWQSRGWQAYLLWPVSQIYRLLVLARKTAYRIGWLKTQGVSLPVVVVGNISVGGTGKTPLCAHLVDLFKQLGWNPGIVSRGYGGLKRSEPHLVEGSDTSVLVGDEPLMLFRQTGVPVCVCVDRAKAVQYLAAHSTVDIVFSDDGLQHLSMPRLFEIIVVDGQRGLGNQWFLPAGPLRESAGRLCSADLVAIQAMEHRVSSAVEHLATDLKLPVSTLENTFHLGLSVAICVVTGERRCLSKFAGRRVIAMAGIGHPERFFISLRKAGIDVTGIAKPDHHVFTQEDLTLDTEIPVLVTSKDAVKMRALNLLPMRVFEVSAVVHVSDSLARRINDLVNTIRAYR